jgi:hypothetical protein
MKGVIQLKLAKRICILALLHQGSTYYGSIIPHLSKGAENNKITIMPTVISENKLTPKEQTTLERPTGFGCRASASKKPPKSNLR